MKGLMIFFGIVFMLVAGLVVLFSGTFTTRYAAGYSERTFDRIRVGMETNIVLQIIGSPLHEYYNRSDSWYWRYTECNNIVIWTYKVRMLRITNGVVAEIIKGTDND